MRKLTIILLTILSSYSVNAQRVIDKGDFFTDKENENLNEQAMNLKQQTTVGALIYTVKKLNGKSPKQFGMDLSEKYPAGEKGINNGVVILLSKNERVIRILTGYGLEWILSDRLSQSIVDSMIVRFKEQDFYGGVNLGLALIEDKVSK